MSDRPTTDPRWATTPAEALSPPSAGLREAGYVAGDVLPSSELNSIFQVLGEHAQWNLDGVRQPAQMSGSPSVTVNAVAKTFTRSTGSWLDDGFHDGMMVTFGSFVNAGNNTTQVIDGEPTDTVLTLTSSSGLVNETDATVSCVSHYYIRQRITSSQPGEFQQSLTVGAALDVGGKITANDQLEVLATSEFGDDVSIQADLLVAGNTDVSSGTLSYGDYSHLGQVLALNAVGGSFHANFAPDTTDLFILSSGSASTLVQIPLKVGDRVTGVVVRTAGNSTATVSAQLRLCDGAGSSSSLGTTTAIPSATWQNLTPTVSAHTMAGNESLVLLLSVNAAAGRFSTVLVTYERP